MRMVRSQRLFSSFAATALCSLVALAVATSVVLAQAPVVQTPDAGTATLPRVALTTGRSTILETTFDVTRIAVTNPAVADATVVRQREILIDGKAPGTISLIVWGTDTRVQYDVVVDQPVPPLEQQLHQLFPNDDIQVAVNADAVILSGRVT